MPAEQDELLLEIKLDEGATEKRIVSLRQTLEGLKRQADLVKKEFKDNAITSEQYAAAIIKIERQTKAVNTQLASNQRTLELFGKSQKAAVGSLDQMRAVLPQLTAQYAALSAEERKNADVGQVLQKRIRSLTDELKEEEERLGNHKRSVGDYAKALKDLDGSFGLLGSGVDKVVVFLETAKKGLEATRTGLTGVKAAIAGTGIGLLIVALGALATWLTKTQKGMEFIAKATGAVGAAFNFVLKGVTSFGEAVFNTFDSSQKEARDLGDVIKENLTNRFEAFKRILDGIAKVDLKEIGKGLIQLFTGVKPESIQAAVQGMADAAAQGAKVAQETIDIEKAERKLLLTRAQNRAEIERQKKISEDVTLSTKDRIAAAEKASAIEQGTLQGLIALEDRRIRNLKDRRELDKENIDLINELNEAEIHRAELSEESLGKQTELQNTLNSLRLEGARSELQAQVDTYEAMILKQEEMQRATLSALSNLTLDKEQREELISQATDVNNAIFVDTKRRLIKQAELETVGMAKNSAERLAIEARVQAQIALMDAEFLAERGAAADRATEKYYERRLTEARKGSKQEFEFKKVQIDLQAKMEADEAKRTITNARELSETLAAIETKRIDGLKQLQIDRNKEVFDRVVGMAEQATQTLSQSYEAVIQAQTAALDQQQKAALESAGLNADAREKVEKDFAKHREKIEKEAAEKRRRIASIENKINTAKAVVAAWANNPNPIVAAITTALVLLHARAQQQIIDTQKFAQGGYVSDGRGSYITGPGTGKSDSINAQISNGESVVNAVSTRKHYRLLSAINVDGGGRPFPGTPRHQPLLSSRFAMGGVAGSVSAGIDTNQLAAALKVALRDMPQPVVAVTDIHRTSNSMRQVEVRADS